MRWKNLQHNQCPKCGHTLKETAGVFRCSDCNFLIGKAKKQSITDKMEDEAVGRIQELAAAGQRAENAYWADPDIM